MTQPKSLIINSPYDTWLQARDDDAIEAGLVKTPRVVIRDDALPDAKTYRSKLYHIRAVNERGGFGVWCWDVAFVPAQMQDILAKHR